MKPPVSFARLDTVQLVTQVDDLEAAFKLPISSLCERGQKYLILFLVFVSLL